MSAFAETTLRLAHGRTLRLGARGVLMGILNVTPDSFSDGGAFANVDAAVEYALRMAEEGAEIIDVGGESTRPGAEAVSADEEMRRVVPVIEALAARTDALVSIDTYRARTARVAVEAGAHIVNDVTALLGDPDMARTVAETGAALVAMHNSRPELRPRREADPVADQHAFLRELEPRLAEAGIANDRVMFDPGIGFGKDADENLLLLARMEEIARGPYPVLLGTSRKRFLGAVTGRDAAERDAATAATTALGRRAGAAVFRVHDVATNRDALRVADAVLAVEHQT